MAVDPSFIDNSGGAPSYSGADLRLGLIVPHFAGAGASLGVYSGVRLSGSGTDLLVAAQSSPNMTVKVNPGCFVAQGLISATQGAYTWALDAVTNVTISAAHATLDRFDLIAVRIRDANVDTSGQRDGAVVVVTGTNGGGVPALPTDASYFVLAQISVVHAVTSITAGAISDKRTFCTALGGVVPFVSTNRPTGMVDGQRGWEIDTSVPYTYRAGSLNKWLRDPTPIVAIADSSWTSTITFTGIPSGNTFPSGGFTFPAEANCRYLFELEMAVIGQAGVGLGAAINQPSGCATDGHAYGWSTAPAWYANFNQNLTAAAAGIGSYGSGSFRYSALVTNGSTAGTYFISFAQGVSSASTSWALKGSSFIVRQVS